MTDRTTAPCTRTAIDPGDFKTCFDLLSAADLSFDYWSPTAREAPSTQVLLYTGGDWVDHRTEARLLAFVENGGTLLAFNRYPRLRTDMRTRTHHGLYPGAGLAGHGRAARGPADG
jgi:hypothetical protein